MFYFSGRPDAANPIWIAGVVPALAVEILPSVRSGEVGLDIAAAVVAVMYSGGTFLEVFAEGRARREMHDLLSRVPGPRPGTAMVGCVRWRSGRLAWGRTGDILGRICHGRDGRSWGLVRRHRRGSLSI